MVDDPIPMHLQAALIRLSEFKDIRGKKGHEFEREHCANGIQDELEELEGQIRLKYTAYKKSPRE